MKRLATALLFLTWGLQAENAAERLDSSSSVFREIMDTGDRAIPQDLLQKAECIVIVPGMKKGAFIVGANFGRGYVSCRTSRVGWSAPAAVRMEGGSFG